MNKIILWFGGIVIIVNTIFLSFFIYENTLLPQEKLGAGFLDKGKANLVGSSSNYVSLPLTAVFADATTTDDYNATSRLADGGDVINQVVETSGIRKILLKINGLGGTATSTMYVRQMGSFDGVNYANIASSTAVYANLVGTTTLTVDMPKTFQFDFGVASTTQALVIPFEIDGWKYTRFIMWGDDLSADPNDGAQAWVEAILVEDISR